jgi:tight adherence protein B
MKFGALALIWLGVGVFVYTSCTHPRGLLRRLGSAYAAGLDRTFRAMFMPARGEQIAWLQLSVALALIALASITQRNELFGAAALAAVLPPLSVQLKVKKRRARIDAQAHGFALALANTLKTTASVGDAVRLTLDVTPQPIKGEIDTALREVRVGSTLEEALLATAARAGAPALDVVVSALLIGQKTGGDLPRILEGTASSLRELKRLEELTERVTSSAKQSLAVAASITAGLAIMLPRVMPGFFEPLRHTVKGQLIAAQCAAVYAFAVFLGWKFTRKSI